MFLEVVFKFNLEWHHGLIKYVFLELIFFLTNQEHQISIFLCIYF